MTEKKPLVHDTDFVVPPTTESLMKEDESLRAALERGDLATFSMWLQKQEHDLHDDAVEHALVLVRAARILNAANETGSASELLLRAAKLARGSADTEEKIVALLEQIGGDAAVEKLASAMKEEAGAARSKELSAVNDEYADVQKQLIALGAHDWQEQTEKKFSEEERQSEITALKKRHQELAYRRSELMQK